MSVFDYVPGVSNVIGAAKGDWKQAVGGAGTEIIRNRKAITNAAGVTNPDQPDISKGPDVQNQRDFATYLRAQYAARQPGAAPTVTAGPVGATTLNQQTANQARAVGMSNIGDLQGVASGATRTAADSMYQQGTDEAASRARGMAAAYSRDNPGAALREGLSAGNQAQAAATAGAGVLKANEQAAARGEIGNFADSIRGADLGAAGQDANIANNTAQFNTTADLNAQKSNQDANLAQQGVNNNYDINKGNQVIGGNAAPVTSDYASQQVKLGEDKANAEGTSSLYSSLGKGAMSLSDSRAKTDVKPTSLADALGKGVHGVTYKYRDGIEDSSKHAGILAQDLERVLPGVVAKGADGYKRVDTGHLTMANTGAVAELAKRLRELEGKRA